MDSNTADMERSCQLSHGDWRFAGCLVILVLTLGGFRMAVGVCGVFHDDAIYVSTAKSLADGDGYRLTGVPGAPLQTKYPILYPALLAVVWVAWPSFPENLIVMQGITLLSAAATVAMTYLYLVRFGYFSRSVAAAACLISATSSSFLYFSTITMAEMPFALLLVSALWAVDGHLLRSGTSRLARFSVGVLVGLPFICRTIGAPVMLAALWVLFRAKRNLSWYVTGMTLVALPWILWSMVGRGIWNENPIDGYYTDYFGCWSSTGLGLFGRVVTLNTIAAACGNGELCLEGLSDLVLPLAGNGVRMTVLIAVGFVPWLKLFPQLRGQRCLPWAFSSYLLLVLVWSWPPNRFLVPILPFIAAYFCAGLVKLMSMVLSPRAVRRTAFAGLAVVLLTNLLLLAQHRQRVLRTGYPCLKLADTMTEWSSYEEVFSWLKNYSRTGDVVASGFDSMILLYTDGTGFRPYVYRPDKLFYQSSPERFLTSEELAAFLKHYGSRYLVQIPMPGFAEESQIQEVVRELADQHPDWLSPVFVSRDSRFVIYETVSAHEPAESGSGRVSLADACP